MARPPLEVADIFRAHGPAWRQANAGHVSLGALKVMSAIEHCRTAALGGHVAHCETCAHTEIAYNSCRNRHCPKCQGGAAKRWLQDRQRDLLPVEYYHVVFTLPAPIGEVAFHNKSVLYNILFKAASETLLTLAADNKHLGVRIGLIAIQHAEAVVAGLPRAIGICVELIGVRSVRAVVTNLTDAIGAVHVHGDRALVSPPQRPQLHPARSRGPRL